MFHIPLKYASSYYIFLIQNKRESPVGLVLGVGTLEYVNLDSLDVDVQFYVLRFRLSMHFYTLLMGEETPVHFWKWDNERRLWQKQRESQSIMQKLCSESAQGQKGEGPV